MLLRRSENILSTSRGGRDSKLCENISPSQLHCFFRIWTPQGNPPVSWKTGSRVVFVLISRDSLKITFFLETIRIFTTRENWAQRRARASFQNLMTPFKKWPIFKSEPVFGENVGTENVSVRNFFSKCFLFDGNELHNTWKLGCKQSPARGRAWWTEAKNRKLGRRKYLTGQIVKAGASLGSDLKA